MFCHYNSAGCDQVSMIPNYSGASINSLGRQLSYFVLITVSEQLLLIEKTGITDPLLSFIQKVYFMSITGVPPYYSYTVLIYLGVYCNDVRSSSVSKLTKFFMKPCCSQ